MNKLLGAALIVLSGVVALVTYSSGTIPCRAASGNCADISQDPQQFWTYWLLIVGVTLISGIYIYFKDRL